VEQREKIIEPVGAVGVDEAAAQLSIEDALVLLRVHPDTHPAERYRRAPATKGGSQRWPRLTAAADETRERYRNQHRLLHREGERACDVAP
jgi:hypothetical protein